MLKQIKKILGDIVIWLKSNKKDLNQETTLPIIPAEFKSKTTKPITTVGIILHDRTQRGDWSRRVSGIHENSGSNKTSQRNDSTGVGGHDDSNSGKDARPRTSTSHKDVVKSSATRVRRSNTEASSQLSRQCNRSTKGFLEMDLLRIDIITYPERFYMYLSQILWRLLYCICRAVL